MELSDSEPRTSVFKIDGARKLTRVEPPLAKELIHTGARGRLHHGHVRT